MQYTVLGVFCHVCCGTLFYSHSTYSCIFRPKITKFNFKKRKLILVVVEDNEGAEQTEVKQEHTFVFRQASRRYSQFITMHQVGFWLIVRVCPLATSTYCKSIMQPYHISEFVCTLEFVVGICFVKVWANQNLRAYGLCCIVTLYSSKVVNMTVIGDSTVEQDNYMQAYMPIEATWVI